MHLLARREHSRAELGRKLSPHASPEELESLLDDLVRLGLLSDARTAESYVRGRANRLGPTRLANDLRRRGITEELASRVLKDAATDEFATARSVWLKKFGSPPVDARDKARQVRFLQGRGFSVEVALTVIKGGDID